MIDKGLNKGLVQKFNTSDRRTKGSFFGFRKMFWDNLKKLNVPFFDACCDEASENLPVRYTVEDGIQVFNGTGWITPVGTGIVDGVPDLQTVLSVDYATNIRAEFNGGLVVEGILDMGISEIRYSSVGSLFTGSLKCGENFTEDQTLFLPNESGTIATIENITLQSITDNGNVTTNSIKLKFDATGFIGDLNVTGNALSDNRNYDLPDESGTIALNKRAVNILEFTDNADAISNGLTAGEMYRTGDVLKVVH
jgi:hypothetical protein